MTRFRSITLAGLLAVGACGLPGDLTRPEPLFGTPEDRPDAERPSRRVESGLDTIRTGDEGDPRGEGADPFDDVTTPGAEATEADTPDTGGDENVTD